MMTSHPIGRTHVLLAVRTIALATIGWMLSANTALYAQTCIDHDGDGWGWNGVASCVVGSPAQTVQQGSGDCIDPDGDGYGWNGVASCEVSATSPQNDNTSAACVDADGDGYGWNGVASCVVGSDRPTPQGGNTNATCVDEDGDGWGWDGSQSCRISAGASSSGGGAPCIDDDGDGWGWDGSNSCRTQAALASGPASITDLVLVTGQSNALGAGTAFDWSLDRGHSQVYAFTDSGWRIADLRQVWDLGWHPRTNPGTDPHNNFALHFGKRLVQRDPSRVVGFVLASAPGQPISHWSYNSDFYNSIRAKVSRAINQLPHKSQLDGILFHQGESDGADSNSYGQDLRNLIHNLRSEPWFDYGRPFICGETARLPVNNQLNSLNRDTDPYTGCVQASNLPVHLDEQHFTASALRALGARYADRYLSIVD
jgi:hypothetical protein